MICIQKYTSLSLQKLIWKYVAKKPNLQNVCGDYFIIIHTLRTKGYVHKSVRPWSLNCSIVPVFWSPFEVSFQNISPFSNRIKPKLFETLSDTTESNAQRNKLSLQATTSSGISHFRKTHLKCREVVMEVLCCAMLCSAVLWSAVLCCAVLCYEVLCCAVLCTAVHCCAMLSGEVVCCAVLCCEVLCCTVQYCAVLCCAVVYINCKVEQKL